MRRNDRRALLAQVAFACIAATALVAPRARAEEPPSYRVTPTDQRIAVDGVLDEVPWKDAPTLELAQKEPVPLGPTPYATVVRILRTADALYFGFHCVDPDPS